MYKQVLKVNYLKQCLKKQSFNATLLYQYIYLILIGNAQECTYVVIVAVFK